MPEPEPQHDHHDVGVAVEASGGFGHGLRALHAFAPGDVVLLEESPSCVLHSHADVNAQLLDSVCCASGLDSESDMARTISGAMELWISSNTATRTRLLEHFAAPDDLGGLGAFVEQLVRDIQALHSPLASSDPKDLARAVLVWLLSAHTISQGMALFTIGHRCNHSCSPNVVFQNSADGDGLVFRALRPIEIGELVTVSYLVGPELMSPGFVRRELLAKRKCFECACARCLEEQSESTVGNTKAAEAEKLHRHPELVAAALADTLEVSTLDRSTWGGHWIFASALWSEAIQRLRAGVEHNDVQLMHSSIPLLDEYFAWVSNRHPSELHFASAQAADCYACISTRADEIMAATVARLCAPYMESLNYEYGVDDAQNKQMQAWLLSRCGQCGIPAKSRCARCQQVCYCGPKCQKLAWKAHKCVCVAQVATTKDT